MSAKPSKPACRFRILFSVCLALICIMIRHCNANPAVTQAAPHPFSAKARLLRFWRRELPTVTLPSFLLQKASPLNATSLAVLSALIDTHNLSAHITLFCTTADLLCATKIHADSNAKATDEGDRDFSNYHGKTFKTYKVGSKSQTDSFKNYSSDDNVNSDRFQRYGAGGNSALQTFANYANNINVGDEEFKSYGHGSTGSTRGFTTYGASSNVVTHNFSNYGTDSQDRQSFQSYADNANEVTNQFKTYDKDASGVSTDFSSYGKDANVIGNSFSSYDNNGNSLSDRFSTYVGGSNFPQETFQNYATNSNGALQDFSNYADSANVPNETFTSYGKGANTAQIIFTSYDNSASISQNLFKSYSEDANASVIFTSYARNTDFRKYHHKEGASFNSYAPNTSSLTGSLAVGIEPGKFFRETLLSEGKEIPLPDLKDYMAPRSFLPCSLAERFPVTSANLPNILSFFGIPENSTMESMMRSTVADCERAPAASETKRCVASVEAMAEFAKEVLGNRLNVLTTTSTEGSRQKVLMGKVLGLHGGRVTRSVSCHQSMFPFLVYYCHSVPKVRVYEAELLREKHRVKINDWVGICHLDTSAWSGGHAAFVALGGQPGHIEVCHWIFEDDLIWVPSS